MSYSFHHGPAQISGRVVSGPDQAVAGAAIGIIVLDLRYPLFPGNVANASTFDFPVSYRILKGAGVEILDADPKIGDMVIEAGLELEAQGCRAIVGSCGYFGFYQQRASRAFKAATFMSSLCQVPQILTSLKPDQTLGVICASADSLNADILTQCGVVDSSRLKVAGARDLPEFTNIIGCTGAFDSARLETEMVDLATGFVSDNPDIGAILLECSDMPPYAWAIQNAVRRPVYDFITMINWIQAAVVRQPFHGFM